MCVCVCSSQNSAINYVIVAQTTEQTLNTETRYFSIHTSKRHGKNRTYGMRAQAPPPPPPIPIHQISFERRHLQHSAAIARSRPSFWYATDSSVVISCSYKFLVTAVYPILRPVSLPATTVPASLLPRREHFGSWAAPSPLDLPARVAGLSSSSIIIGSGKSFQFLANSETINTIMHGGCTNGFVIVNTHVVSRAEGRTRNVQRRSATSTS